VKDERQDTIVGQEIQYTLAQPEHNNTDVMSERQRTDVDQRHGRREP